MERSELEDSLGENADGAGLILIPKLPPVEFSLACRELSACTPERKPSAAVQVLLTDTQEQSFIPYSWTEVVERTRDPLFLSGVTFPSECQLCEETRVKLIVYDMKDRTHDTRNIVGCATFSVGELLKSKEQQLTLSLRTSDGGSTVGTVVVSRLQMGEMEDGEVDHVVAGVQGQTCSVMFESPHRTTKDRDSTPLMNSVFKNPVCKVYRFQTVDCQWMEVRERMTECSLSFSVPKQLLALYIQEDMRRLEDLKSLGELSPHWDNLRKDVVNHYGQAINSYQETLAELTKLTGPSFKPSSCKGQKYLEFIPINLHTQRMRVASPKKADAFYDIVTVGAPAAHIQGFKNGGLQRLLSRYEAEKKNFSTTYQCIYYSPEHTDKAREVLSSVSQLEPRISGLADQILLVAQQHSPEHLKEALQALCEKTEQFVHSLKDELVKTALLALHAARPGYVSKGNSAVCNNVGGCESPHREEASPRLKQQDSIPHHCEYDEEEWDRVWANVAKSLNCIIAMVDRLEEREKNTPEPLQGADTQTEMEPKPETPAEPDLPEATPTPVPVTGDWQEQLYPLVVTLKDCIGEAVALAKQSMTFVLLQEAACGIPQGLLLKQRRDMVFSQALAALTCGFVMRLYAGVEDGPFLQQLHLVGLVAQFESLLSTYSEEVGMLEDMEVGISDLHRVTFLITQAESTEPEHLQPVVTGRRDHYSVEVPLPREAFQTLPGAIREGKPLHVHPVLFNVGINEQQTIAERFGDISLQERINQKNFDVLDRYYTSLSDTVPPECLPCSQTQTDLKELLETLRQNVVAKKRKNVEILWLAGTICRRLNGIRFTSCKSAKDRTSMSVTLEQCALLRDEHELNSEHFVKALDCMRSSRLALSEGSQCEDPEVGSVADNKPASRHFYPIALLLVSSHLLVVWLILSLVFLLAKYQ